MTNKDKLKRAYKERIAYGVDDKSVYESALKKIDDCPDSVLWALTHRDKEDWNEEFTELDFYY
jgi:hypothetical protein